MIEYLISVIVPVYNAKKTLKRCVDSIINQSYLNIEIILVDDGSDDGSMSDCDHLVYVDPRIRVIHQVNQGVSSARNKGIESAKGDYITFVDADDWIDENVCEKFVKALQKKDYDLFCFSAVYENQKKSRESLLFASDIVLLSKMQREEFLCKMMTPWSPWFEFNANTRFAGSSWGKFYKTAILKEKGLCFTRDVRISEDVMFNICSFDFFKNIGYSRQSFYHYKICAESAQNRYRSNSLVDFGKVINSIQNWQSLVPRSQHIRDSANTLYIHYLFGTLKEDLFHKDNPNKKQSIIRLKKLLSDSNYQQILQKSNPNYFTIAEKCLIFLMKKKMARIIVLLMTVYVRFA